MITKANANVITMFNIDICLPSKSEGKAYLNFQQILSQFPSCRSLEMFPCISIL